MKATQRTKKCQFCQKTIKCPYRMGVGVWNRKKYCSMECFYKGRTQKVGLICQYCHKEFFVFKSWANLRKRCSKRCESLDKKGKHFSPTTEIKKGNISWNKGLGNGTETKRMRGSKEYGIWRAAVFMRDDHTCQNCGQKVGTLHADHINSWALYPELRFAIDNGRVLCVECHRQTDNYAGRGIRKDDYIFHD